MLTYRCNLNCSYCFANEFVNKDNTDISFENFTKAIEFLTNESNVKIGLIGGEPTIHPKFLEILESLIINQKIDQVTIYTNGIELSNFINTISNPKVKLLVNLNNIKSIGEYNYNKIISNLDELIFNQNMKNRVNLGINLYDNDMDFEYILNVVKRYNMHRLRISLTVPDFSKYKCNSILDTFRNRKDFLLSFLSVLIDNDILPYYDCNKPPYCIWDENEKTYLEEKLKRFSGVENNLIGDQSFCYPVIDILPNLNAVRCFGMSDFTKINILDFQNITQLASFFLNEVDAFAYQVYKDLECSDCVTRKTRQCTTGCIGFKSKEIKMIKSYISGLNKI